VAAAAVRVLWDWLELVLHKLVMVVLELPLQYLEQLRPMQVVAGVVLLRVQPLALAVLEAVALVRHLQIIHKVLALTALQIQVAAVVALLIMVCQLLLKHQAVAVS
jgi:hypothetical protein